MRESSRKRGVHDNGSAIPRRNVWRVWLLTECLGQAADSMSSVYLRLLWGEETVAVTDWHSHQQDVSRRASIGIDMHRLKQSVHDVEQALHPKWVEACLHADMRGGSFG